MLVRCAFACVVFVAACSSGAITSALVSDDASTNEDAQQFRDGSNSEDAQQTEYDSGGWQLWDAGAGDDVEDLDVSVQDDVAPPQDSAPPPVDAGPCVEYVEVPASPYWAAWAHYASQSVPYYCPTSVQGNSCRAAMRIEPGTVDHAPSGQPEYITPWPIGTCHIAVPSQCLPCTGTITQW